MRLSIWIALSLTVGLFLGHMGKVEPKVQYSRINDLLRISAVFNLARQFAAEMGREPSNMEELRQWCADDHTRRMVYDKAERTTAPDGNVGSWKIYPDAKGDELYISSDGPTGPEGDVYVAITSGGKYVVKKGNNR